MSEAEHAIENDVDTLENRFAWWGASRLAIWLVDVLRDEAKSNQFLKKSSTLANILYFLVQNKSDMLNFIFSNGSIGLKLAQVKDKKGKVKEYKPVCLAWNGYSKSSRDELEFISPQEYKYRDTAKILGDALSRAADMLALFTGKNKNELLNSLIAGNTVDIPTDFVEPVPRHENKIQAVIVISESEYEAKKQ